MRLIKHDLPIELEPLKNNLVPFESCFKDNHFVSLSGKVFSKENQAKIDRFFTKILSWYPDRVVFSFRMLHESYCEDYAGFKKSLGYSDYDEYFNDFGFIYYTARKGKSSPLSSENYNIENLDKFLSANPIAKELFDNFDYPNIYDRDIWSKAIVSKSTKKSIIDSFCKITGREASAFNLKAFAKVANKFHATNRAEYKLITEKGADAFVLNKYLPNTLEKCQIDKLLNSKEIIIPACISYIKDNAFDLNGETIDRVSFEASSKLTSLNGGAFINGHIKEIDLRNCSLNAQKASFKVNQNSNLVVDSILANCPPQYTTKEPKKPILKELTYRNGVDNIQKTDVSNILEKSQNKDFKLDILVLAVDGGMIKICDHHNKVIHCKGVKFKVC